MRMIDADALKEKIDSMWNGRPLSFLGARILVTIDEAPTIDADRPQGEWIDIGDFEQCSVCKGTHLKEFQSYYGKTTWIKTPYCPNCVARMKGADDE